MSGKRPKVYYIAPNGFKIEMKGFGPASLYAQEQIRNELVKAFQVPKDMIFPAENIQVDVPMGGCLDVALTDELRSKGSVEIKFDYPKECKLCQSLRSNYV